MSGDNDHCYQCRTFAYCKSVHSILHTLTTARAPVAHLSPRGALRSLVNTNQTLKNYNLVEVVPWKGILQKMEPKRSTNGRTPQTARLCVVGEELILGVITVTGLQQEFIKRKSKLIIAPLTLLLKTYTDRQDS